MTALDNCDISLMIYDQSRAIASKKRGRPCAIDRYKTDLIQQKFTNILNSNSSHQTAHLAQNIMPFIVTRQRRQRANNRERSRMQTLNSALIILRQHLPIDLYLQSKTNVQSQIELECQKNSDEKSSKVEKCPAKMTKIDTLRFAAEYIRLLTDVLTDCQRQETAVCRSFNRNEVSFTSDTSNNSESGVSEMSGLSSADSVSRPVESFVSNTGFVSNCHQSYYYYHHQQQSAFYNNDTIVGQHGLANKYAASSKIY